MNSFLFHDRMSALYDFSGFFSSGSNRSNRSTSNSQTSYKDMLANILNQSTQSQTSQTVSTGRSISYAESYAAAKSIYRSHDEDKIMAVQRTIQIGAGIQDNIDRDAMSMAEYKKYFMQKVRSLPMDYTHQDDTEIIKISEDGWAEMKSNENYEAWVLGYLKQDFAYRNPFYGVGSVRGNYIVEEFGASVNEHRGQSEAKIDPVEAAKNASEAAERRRKKRKQMLELEEELLMQKKAAEHIKQIKAMNTLHSLNRFDDQQVESIGVVLTPTISAALVLSFNSV